MKVRDAIEYVLAVHPRVAFPVQWWSSLLIGEEQLPSYDADIIEHQEWICSSWYGETKSYKTLSNYTTLPLMNIYELPRNALLARQAGMYNS